MPDVGPQLLSGARNGVLWSAVAYIDGDKGYQPRSITPCHAVTSRRLSLLHIRRRFFGLVGVSLLYASKKDLKKNKLDG